MSINAVIGVFDFYERRVSHKIKIFDLMGKEKLLNSEDIFFSALLKIFQCHTFEGQKFGLIIITPSDLMKA